VDSTVTSSKERKYREASFFREMLYRASVIN
jgi:hypothetical protein